MTKSDRSVLGEMLENHQQDNAHCTCGRLNVSVSEGLHANWGRRQNEHVVDTILDAGFHRNHVLTTIAEMDRLPVLSIVRTSIQNTIMEKLSDGWFRPGVDHGYTPFPNWLPVEVLYEPAVAHKNEIPS